MFSADLLVNCFVFVCDTQREEDDNQSCKSYNDSNQRTIHAVPILKADSKTYSSLGRCIGESGRSGDEGSKDGELHFVSRVLKG